MMIAISIPPPPPSMSQTSTAQSHEHITSANMTASLTILPASPMHSPSSLHHPPLYSTAPRRPKLHLNTSNVRTFGRGSSLRLDTLSAISPTVRNTYSNAYDGAPASAAPVLYNPSRDSYPSQQRENITPLSQPASASRVDVETPNSASTQASSSAESTLSSEHESSEPPYKLTHNIPSILTNSPIKYLRKRRMTGSSRPMFPPVKHVSFRTPLEEEIRTSRYILAHSDLEDSILSTTSSLSLSSSSSALEASTGSTTSLLSDSSDSRASARSPSPESSEQASSPTPSNASDDSLRRTPRTGEKRDSSSDSESDSCPETPVAGRRKRRREWVWTLGPIARSSTSSSLGTSGTEQSSLA